MKVMAKLPKYNTPETGVREEEEEEDEKDESKRRVNKQEKR